MNNSVKSKAFSIGELAVDWLSLEYGESMMTATKFYRYLGGNAANVAVGLARLGLQSAIISKVGRDIHSEYLLARLNEEGVDASYVACDSNQPTAQCYMVRRADGLPDYIAWPSPNASKTLKPEDIPDECIEQSWIWHMAAVSFIARPRRFAVLDLVERARKADKIISFDACFPLVQSDSGRQAAWQAMQLADIVRLNWAEAAYWSGLPFHTEPALMAEHLIRELPAVSLLIITLADKGAMLFSGGKSCLVPPFKIDKAESIGDVGPGDAFSAGLIYGLSTLSEANSESMSRAALLGLSLESWLSISRYAACAGALVTRAYSATERFPRLDELKLALGETTLQS